MNRVLVPAILVFLLPVPFAAAQDEWTDLGGSTAVGGLSKSPDIISSEPSVAVSPAGTVFISWSEWLDEGQDVRVAMWDADAEKWVEIGDGLDIPAKNFIVPLSVIRVGEDELPIVAWTGGDLFGGKIYLKKWDGAMWVELGGSATGAGVSIDGGMSSSNPTMELDGEGNPVVAWQGGVGFAIHVYVRAWTGEAWTDFAGSAISGIEADLSGAFSPSLALDPAGNPWVAYWGKPGFLFITGELHVRRWTGVVWEEADPGMPAITPSMLSFQKPSIAMGPAGIPALAWTEIGETPAKEKFQNVMVKRLVDGAWSGFGGDPVVHKNVTMMPSAVVDVNPAGDTFVAWIGEDADIHLKSWPSGGAAWEEIEGSASPGGLSASEASSAYPCIAAETSGIAVGWSDLLEGALGSAGEVGLIFMPLDGSAKAGKLHQVQPDGINKLEKEQQVPAGSLVFLGATVYTGDAAAASLELEVRLVGTAFSGIATQAGPPVLSSSKLALPVAGLGSGKYHWQARVKPVGGVPSPWTPFGANPESQPDFVVMGAEEPASSADGGEGSESSDGSSGCSVSTGAPGWTLMILLAALAFRR